MRALPGSLRLVLVVVAAAWAAALALDAAWYSGRSDDVTRAFAEHRLRQLEDVADGVADRLSDVGDDLAFAGRLIQTADDATNRTHELRALIAVVREYRLIEVFGADGQRELVVADPRADVDASVFDEVVRSTAASAALDPGALVSSPRFAGDVGGSLRVFARSLPPSQPGEAAVTLAVLVDMGPLLSSTRLVESNEELGVVLTGGHGRPFSSTDPSIASLLDSPVALQGAPGLATLARDMRAGKRGVIELPPAEDVIKRRASAAEEHEATLAAYVPIAVSDLEHWSLASIGTARGRAVSQRALVLQAALAAGGASVLASLASAALVLGARRAERLRDELKSAVELAHLNELNKRILDTIPTGVCVLVADGTIAGANTAIRDRAGASLEGRGLDAFIGGDDAAAVQALVAETLATQQPRSMVAARVTMFGEPAQANVHCVPIRPPLESAAAILVVEDVTRLRSLEDQLMRAEKLATIGVLAAGVAHEIGTPLGVIRGRAEYVRGKLGEGHPQSDGLAVIVEQIDRISRTIRELLDFARERPKSAASVDLETVASRAVELLRFEAERKKVSLDVDIAAALPPVLADADELQQVVLNLLLNGIDATRAGGRVALRVERDEGAVLLHVVDDGCGIPVALQHRIFDPFYTTKKRGQGTGLGLTVVAQIVQSHGAALEIDSAPGRGSRFTVRWKSAAA